jgi:GDPmannose 4,6-dehydratase|tara:strand:+ start:182 stop:1255 length:1074 start_codon:yes stop_codon:yes gene_type:complete
MKTAIIFGITGQDGSHLADLLLEKNYKVTGVTRRTSTDNTTRISHILNNKNFRLASGDITDASSVLNILREHEQVDEVYNLAAQSHVAVSFKQPGLTWDITGKGCLNILQGLVDLNMLGARFYQASSSEMFGKNYDVELGMTTESKYQNEETKFLPQSPYAIAKCAAHYMTALYRDGYGIHASAGILFNHEGPRRGETFVTRKITKWIGDFVKWMNSLNISYADLSSACEEGDSLFASGVQYSFPKLRLGNLDAYRDWGYAGDYCEAMWMMLQQDEADDYVICTGETHTIREFLDVAFKEAGITDWSSCVIQDPEFYRPAEVDYLRGDCSKANTKLGWTPKHSFEDLVKMMVKHDLE